MANFVVGGGFEIAVELADGAEGFRALEREELIDFLGDLLTSAGRGHGNGGDDVSGDGPQRADGGAHGGAGGEAVVNEDTGATTGISGRMTGAIERFAPGDLLQFTGDNGVEGFLPDRKEAQHLLVEDDNPAAGDRAHG